MKQLEKKLKALANARRLLILKFLKTRREANVQSIAEFLKLSFKATSRHLRVLFLAEIIEKEQRSTSVYYQLAKDAGRTIKLFCDEL
jgi:DNA-binding transcriptional ArsR family regulator